MRKRLFILFVLSLTSLLMGQDYVQNEIIVKYKKSVRTQDIARIRQRMHAGVKASFKSINAELWTIPVEARMAVQMANEHSAIEYAEPNYIVHALETFPNDTHFSDLWGMHNSGQSGGTADADIDAPEAWDTGTGTDVLVGIIDTGVDYYHQDLVNNIWTNPGEIPGNNIDDDGNGYIDDIHGWDFVNNDNDPMDDHSHGTHCAGTIAASGNNSKGVVGVCWSARIMALKFLNANGSGSISEAILAVEYATQMGARLTSNSWGGGGYSQALFDAIEAANSAGQLFIAAAGNNSSDNDISPHFPSSYSNSNIIAVASTDHNDNLSGFSCYGATSVDMAAPGSNIYSTVPNNGYAYKSGTSMATPHVSGAAALLWSLYPTMTHLDVKQLLMDSGEYLSTLVDKTVSGKRLNIYRAVNQMTADEIFASPDKIHTLWLSSAQSIDVVCGTTSSSPDWTASVTSGNSWLSIASGSDGNGNGSIAININANSSGSPRSGTITINAAWADNSPFEVIVNQEGIDNSDILLVDDDDGSSYVNVEDYFTNALTANSLNYYYYNVETSGTTHPDVLNHYLGEEKCVIWFTGSDWSGTLTSDDRNNLSSFLNNGGNLFLTGQDIGFDLGNSPFVNDYLRASYAQDDVNWAGVQGVAKNPVTDGLVLSIDGGSGADNQSFPSEIDPLSSATAIFTYFDNGITPGSDGLMANQKPIKGDNFIDAPISSGTAGLAVDSTYKVVYLSFGFEAIAADSNRNKLMNKICQWLTKVPLIISSTVAECGEIDTPYYTRFLAEGGDAPYSWSVNSDTLPQGLTLNTSTGEITGTPLESGLFTVAIEVEDSSVPAQSAGKTFKINILDASGIDQEFLCGSTNGYDVYIPKSGPYMDNNTTRSSHLYLEIPNSDKFTHWTALDNAPQLRRTCPAGDWQVETKLELTEASAGNYHVGLMVRFDQYDLYYWGFFGDSTLLQLSKSGEHGLLTVPYNQGNTVCLQITKEGNLFNFYYRPDESVSWIHAGSTTRSDIPAHIGIISNTWQTPYVHMKAAFDYLRLTDNTGPVPLEITTTALKAATLNQAYSDTVFVQGGETPYSWSVTNNTLPAGLSLNSSTGVISGTPTSTGTFPFTVQVEDSQAPAASETASKQLSITVADPTAIDEEFITGSFNGYNVHLSKPGPTFDNNNARAGHLRLEIPNTDKFTHWTAVDNAPQLRRDLPEGDWQIETKVELTQITSGSFHTGLTIYFGQFDLYYWGFFCGTNSIQLSKSGQHGLLSETYNNGNIVCLQIRKEGNTFYFEYKADQASDWILAGTTTRTDTPSQFGLIGNTWSTPFVHMIADFDYLRLNSNNAPDPLQITTTSLPAGQTNQAYSATLQAGGGVTPYSWSVTNNTLPAGLSLNSSTGVISGTPTSTGTFPFTVQVEDSQAPAASETASKQLSITVNPEPVIDEEFNSGSLAGYTVYIPKSGPDFDVTSRPGYFRMTLPGNTSFHHWTGSDEAPQLRRELTLNDWSIETNMELTQYTGEQFVIGLCLYFSASDMIYFGFANNTNTIKAFRTGAGLIAGDSYSSGQIIDLRIVKIGSQYSFEFKAPEASTWQSAGTYSESSTPADVGLVGNTWASIALSADFDYLRLTSSPGMNKRIFAMAAEIDIIPDNLTISQSYPNPFNMDTAIELQLPEQSEVRAVLYNSKGQFIKQLVNQNIAAGTHRIHWNGTAFNGETVSSGLYILHLRITDGSGKSEIYSRKLLLTK